MLRIVHMYIYIYINMYGHRACISIYTQAYIQTYAHIPDTRARHTGRHTGIQAHTGMFADKRRHSYMLADIHT